MSNKDHTDYDIIIAGGGLAGLTAANILGRDFKVLLIDPDDYPRHKLCGEYLSAEVEKLLKDIDIDLNKATNVRIDKLLFSTQNGNAIHQKLPLGGYGISRFHLDHLLFKNIDQSVDVKKDKVIEVNNKLNYFEVVTKDQKFTCKQVIMATGKRSVLDKSLSRDFVQRKSPWLGVKCHYEFDMPLDQVELHNFEGGYAGLSKVENGNVNLCYLATFESFKKYKDIDSFNREVLSQNPRLVHFFNNAEPCWEKPIAISQISFDHKKAVENDIMMIGDTAGLIHPLCGNGMAMAIHSAAIAARCIMPFLIDNVSREQCLQDYQQQCKEAFHSRLRVGHWLQRLFLNPTATRLGLGVVKNVPSLLPLIIRKTHGDVIGSI